MRVNISSSHFSKLCVFLHNFIKIVRLFLAAGSINGLSARSLVAPFFQIRKIYSGLFTIEQRFLVMEILRSLVGALCERVYEYLIRASQCQLKQVLQYRVFS